MLDWEGAFGKAYAIEVSPDGAAWTEVYKTEKGVWELISGGLDIVKVRAHAAKMDSRLARRPPPVAVEDVERGFDRTRSGRLDRQVRIVHHGDRLRVAG